MFKKIFESCEDSIVQRVSNPYFGTYIAVLLIDNWKLLYTLFTFNPSDTREERIAIITDYIDQVGGLSCLFLKCAVIAFFPFVIYYVLLHLSGCISNWSELRIKPKLLKRIDKGSVVEKAKYDKLVSRIETLHAKLEEERKKRLETESELDELNKKLMKLQNEQVSASVDSQQEQKPNVKEVINDRQNKFYHQIIAEIRDKNLEEDFDALIRKIRSNESIYDDEPIVEYAVEQGLIHKSDDRYLFTDTGNAIVKIFINTSLPKVIESKIITGF